MSLEAMAMVVASHNYGIIVKAITLSPFPTNDISSPPLKRRIPRQHVLM